MKKFIIASLALAGFTTGKELLAEAPEAAPSEDGNSKFQSILDRALPFSLAAHRSHASHGSHKSHGSHRSSGNSITPMESAPIKYAPAKPNEPKVNRNNNSTPSFSVLPSSPAINLPALKGNSAQFKAITTNVQIRLLALGLYTGEVTGISNTNTTVAISKYQKKNGLPITGKIDEALLNLMGVSIE
jgi:His-Xaa-Ser repeat protein HxsA